MQILHLAFRTQWAEARTAGTYGWSTRGVTVEQEGFVHASRPDQVEGVRSRFYGDVDPADLVLLVVETDLLDVPWRFDRVGDDEFPHVYGPIPASAVVGTLDVTVA